MHFVTHVLLLELQFESTISSAEVLNQVIQKGSQN